MRKPVTLESMPCRLPLLTFKMAFGFKHAWKCSRNSFTFLVRHKGEFANCHTCIPINLQYPQKTLMSL